MGIAMNTKGSASHVWEKLLQMQRKNHFAAKCRSQLMPRSVQTLAEDDEESFNWERLVSIILNKSQSSWKVGTIYIFRWTRVLNAMSFH